MLWDLCSSGLLKVQCLCGHCLGGVHTGCLGVQVGLILQCAHDQMWCSDAWSDACVQCCAMPAKHWDELMAQQLDPVELAVTHLVCLVYVTLCSHLPVRLVRLMRHVPLLSFSWPSRWGVSGWLGALAIMVGQHEQQHDGGSAL